MTSLRLLVFGKTGQVAHALAERSDISAQFLDRGHADLSQPESLTPLIESADCDAVVNAAAYTAVDKAESEPDIARAINALAPGAMARACATKNIPFIHISTDYVFDGTKSGPYLETDPVNPLGIYGATKEEGEREVMAPAGRAAILRTSWVFSPWGNNFVKTMLRLGAEREELKIVADQTGAPTSAIDIADGIVTVARSLAAGQGKAGIYHMTANGETTWHGFARAIFGHALQYGLKTPARLLPIPSSDYPTPAKRPLNSRLDCRKIAREFGVRLPNWQDGLAHVMGRITRGQMISEYDARQLQKMKFQLTAFQRGELILASFIGDLEFLLNAIEGIPLEWKQRVHEFVAILEEVYAVSLDLGHTEVDEQGQRFVAEATEGIQRCLDEIKIPQSQNLE